MESVSADRCPNCGANYAIVGRVHRCISVPGDQQASRDSHFKGESDPVVRQDCPADLPVRRRGRPLDLKKHLTYEALKPWLADGMSRATWYRRRAEARKEKA